MNRKALFLWSLIFTALSYHGSFAQEKAKKADRYESLKLRSQTYNVKDLLDEARELKSTDPALALGKIEEALGLSLTNKNTLDEARCYILIGEINENAEEWKLALENYNTAYEKLKRRFSDTPEFKQTLRGLSNANLKLGNFSQSLQSLQENATLNLTPAERAETQLKISEVYFQQEDYPKALNTVDDINVPPADGAALAAGVQNQRAKIYARQHNTKEATAAIQSSQNVMRSNRGAIAPVQEQALSDAKNEVVDVLHEQKKYDEEIALRNQSIEYNLESNNFPEVSKDKLGISKALVAKGETSAAIKALEEAALIADTTGNPKDQAKAFLALADLYEQNGRNSQALSTYKRYSESVAKYEAQHQTRLTEKADLIRKQKDIEELSKAVEIGQREDAIAEGIMFRQQLTIYGLIFIILIVVVTSYFIYKNAQASKVANQLLALKSLRSQMNPHFIFNALNSVNQFIAQNDELTANKFLSEFSRLMRLVLENSQQDFIPLDKEQEIIALYLKLEHYRFRDKFDYNIDVDEDINPETQLIPPMLIQPYIENAVWHGLRYKEEKGHLSLSFRKNSHGLEVEIIDDGIGRKKSAALKTVNQKKQISTGLKNIQERLDIINKVYKADYQVSISDVDPETESGTKVVIKLSGSNKINGKTPRAV